MISIFLLEIMGLFFFILDFYIKYYSIPFIIFFNSGQRQNNTILATPAITTKIRKKSLNVFT